MPARRTATTSNKRKRTSHREPVSESDFSDIDESDLDIDESDLEELETDSEIEDSEEEFSSDDEVSDDDISSDEESEDERPRKRRRSSTPKKVTKRGKSKTKTGKKTTKSKTKTGKKTTKRSKSKTGKKTTKRSTSKTGKTGKKASKSKAKKKSSGLSEKRLKNRNIPIPMLSAVVEPPKDENGNVIAPVKQDRKFLLVNADGSATTKAYTAKGPYQAALKAANRLEVSKAGDPKTEIRLREPNSQIMYVFEGQREKLEPEKCIYFYCEDNNRKKVSFEEKQAILKKNKDAKIIPICHKSSVKRTARVKLTEDTTTNDTVEATA